MAALTELFGPLEGLAAVEPRYNVAPTQLVAVVRAEGTARTLARLRWGLIPQGARDPAIGAKLINARAETLSERPAYREPFARRRCVVPASGFYEWRTRGQRKTPLYFHRADRRPLALAALWEPWPGGPAPATFTIVTCPPNALLRQIHDRMPALLHPDGLRAWLDPAADPTRLRELLVPYEGELEQRPVGRAVNDVQNDGPDCVREEIEREVQGELF